MGKKTGTFVEGQHVFAKVKGYSPWPAKVRQSVNERGDNLPKHSISSEVCELRFYFRVDLFLQFVQFRQANFNKSKPMNWLNLIRAIEKLKNSRELRLLLDVVAVSL